jgi:hypothetical protein
MKIVPEELSGLLSDSEFKVFHQACGTGFRQDVLRFLSATMDEARLSASSTIAQKVLDTIGIADAGLFREAVLRRELFGTIAYNKQRDHSSHTIYNYLLGWYFCVKCPLMRDALEQAFTERAVPNSNVRPFHKMSTYFGAIWQYASLLHDIGYMFEGNISRMSFEDSSKQAAIGARVARQYFNRTIWVECDIELRSMRSELFKGPTADLHPPPFDRTGTLGDIADELRNIGSLDKLIAAVNEKCDDLDILKHNKPTVDDFSGDAFDIWVSYYDKFKKPNMSKRMKSVRTIFNKLIDQGFPDTDVCLLDHGVCGGLLQLYASTYYYRLYAALSASHPKPRFADRFLSGKRWSPAFWWTGIVWGTAAVALHNVQQLGDARATKLDPAWPGRLALSDDPLAYLGVLVDIVQEWNRYAVFKALDHVPVQGVEVMLGYERGKIVLKFLEPNAAKRAKKLRENLQDALKGWGNLLDVRP